MGAPITVERIIDWLDEAAYDSTLAGCDVDDILLANGLTRDEIDNIDEAVLDEAWRRHILA